MDIEKRIELCLRPPTEELVTEAELRSLLETKRKPVHYIGFEISGLLHVGSLIVSGYKVRDLIEAGFDCQVFLADWHSIINNKLEGDWEKIRRASKYYEEAFKFFCPGAKIVVGSELYHNNDEYWRNVVLFSKKFSLARATRCMQIMGRLENDTLETAAYFYPSMQSVDIKTIGADVAHAGMDQRKVHMLARDEYPKMGWKPPIALHHHILPGLLAPETDGKTKMPTDGKMSKSKPKTAIFVHDTKEQIAEKMKGAFCPATAEGNPVLELAKYVAFREAKEITITRPAKFGGDVSYASYPELERDYAAGKLHAMDLKTGVAEAVDDAVAPVRKHFEQRKELLEVYSETKITR
ncbi:Tyrosine--tRNA ligase [Candidatus Norongarragalina meridionalis]|nr:Tyrosine--tRNA ligase [Candidatus Norongarragalina meridionalis]